MDQTQVREFQERRLELHAQITALAETQDKWSDEDRAKWDTLNSEYDENLASLAKYEEAKKVAARTAQLHEQIEREQHERASEVGEARAERDGRVTEEQRGLALQAWLRSQNDLRLTQKHERACYATGVNPRSKALDVFRSITPTTTGFGMWARNGGNAICTAEYNRQREEHRAMSTTDGSGGYTIPTGFSNELERSMLAFGGMRSVARIFPTATGNDLDWPTTNDTSNTGELLAEAGAIGSSVDPAFAVVTLQAFKYSSKAVLVSAELLEDSYFNLGQMLGSMLGERIARITNTHFTTGDASSKPNGVVTAAGAGVTAAATGAITSDELIDLVHSLDPAYRTFASTGFMMEDATLKAVRKLKDGNNQYHWQPGLQSSEPDMLLGFPYTINQDMASLSASADTVIFGAFEKYIIRDVAQVRFFRLEERYRDNDQTGFIMFSRHDGDLLDAGTDPVVKLTQAAV